MGSLHYTQIILRSTWRKVSLLLVTSWQLFDNDSDFSGSDSDGEEVEDIYAYWGPTLSTSSLGEETLDSIFSGKCFNESALHLLLARNTKAVLKE